MTPGCGCSHSPNPTGQVVALTSLTPGQCGIVRSLSGGRKTDCAYLRALGLRRNMRVKLCRSSGTWIVEVGCSGGPSCRIGLARSLAEHVQIELCQNSP